MTAASVATLDYSGLIGLTAIQVVQTGQLRHGLSYYRIWNVAATGLGTIWVSRSGSPAGINAPGSFPLAPGQYEEFKPPSSIPRNGLSLIATQPGTPVTIEIG